MGMIDTEKIRNAAEVLDTLTSKLDHNHRLRVEAEHIAKSSVSFLYEIADTIDAQTAEIAEAKGQIEHLDRQNNALREALHDLLASLSESDEEGLMEHAEVVISARAVLSGESKMLMTQEHYDLMTNFERSHSGRFDREDKSLWPMGVIYQDGHVNELFLAYRNGYAYSQADTRSDIQNLESSRDGYRRDVETLRDALLGLLDALPSATTHPTIKRAKDALRETCHD